MLSAEYIKLDSTISSFVMLQQWKINKPLNLKPGAETPLIPLSTFNIILFCTTSSWGTSDHGTWSLFSAKGI